MTFYPLIPSVVSKRTCFPLKNIFLSVLTNLYINTAVSKLISARLNLVSFFFVSLPGPVFGVENHSDLRFISSLAKKKKFFAVLTTKIRFTLLLSFSKSGVSNFKRGNKTITSFLKIKNKVTKRLNWQPTPTLWKLRENNNHFRSRDDTFLLNECHAKRTTSVF